MATASPFAPHLAHHHNHPQAARTRSGRPIVPMQPVVRRRGSMEQGRALESLGHALEYLEDSRARMDGGDESAEVEAMQILRKASRTVFAECPVVHSLRVRLGRWMAATLFGA